jgi:LPS O-antigen subunit length determinant protein (WzzB/FepE family)
VIALLFFAALFAGELEAQLTAGAWVIAALALFIIAVGVVYLLMRRQFQTIDARVTTKLGTIETTVTQTHTEVQQVNKAVNHVGPDDSAPLIQRVRDLEAHADDLEEHTRWHRQVLALLALNLGVDLPPHPKDRAA